MRRRRLLLTLAIAVAVAVLAAGAILWLRPGMEAVPPPRRPSGALPEPPESSIAMPVWVSRADLQSLLDHDLAPSDDMGRDRGDVGLDWHVDPVRLEPVDGGVRAVTGIRGRLTAHKVVTVAVESAATVAVAVAPRITAAWRLEPHAIASVSVAMARIRALGLDISFDGKAERALRPLAGQVARSCNRLVAALPLRGLMQLVWMLAQSPLQVRRSAPEVWLQLRPEAVQIGPVALTADRLELRFGLRCRPLLGIARIPPSPPRTPLPPPEAPGPPGFALTVPVRVHYARIAEDILGRISARTYRLAREGSLRITDLTLYPSDTHLVAGLRIDAKLPGRILDTTGWIYAWGIPRCDPASGEVRIDGLDFHEDTASRLAHLADGALHDILLGELRGELERRLARSVADARTKAQAAIAGCTLGKGIVLAGTIREIGVAALALEEDDLALGVVCRGEAAIRCELALPPPDPADDLFAP